MCTSALNLPTIHGLIPLVLQLMKNNLKPYDKFRAWTPLVLRTLRTQRVQSYAVGHCGLIQAGVWGLSEAWDLD